MSRAWNDAIQEFAAMTAAINAGTMARAGLLTEAERNTMTAFLAAAEKVAGTPDQSAIFFSLNQLLGGATLP